MSNIATQAVFVPVAAATFIAAGWNPIPVVISISYIYLLVSIPAYFLQGITLVMTLSLRAMRKVKAPMVASIISFFVNIFFNWVFIFGNLGAPELQIAGAALGTVLARVAEFLIIGYFFFKADKDVRFRVRDLLSPCKEQLKPFLKYATPVLISDTLLTFGNNALSVIMGHIGTNFVAAYSIVVPVMRLCNVSGSGVGMSAATLTGNIVGEGNREKAQQCGATCLALTVACGLVAGAIIKLICPAVISLYQITAETQAIATELMDAAAIMVLFMATQSVLTKGVLRGGGDTRFLMVIDVIFLWVLSVPLGILTGLVWKMSPFIIYIALRTDHIVKTFFCAVRMFRGKWIKRVKDDSAACIPEET